jgi:hypothetical protein
MVERRTRDRWSNPAFQLLSHCSGVRKFFDMHRRNVASCSNCLTSDIGRNSCWNSGSCVVKEWDHSFWGSGYLYQACLVAILWLVFTCPWSKVPSINVFSSKCFRFLEGDPQITTECSKCRVDFGVSPVVSHYFLSPLLSVSCWLTYGYFLR